MEAPETVKPVTLMRINKPGSREVPWIFLVSAAVIIATQVLLMWVPTFGVYFNALVLAFFIGIGIRDEYFRSFAVSCAIIPVANMVVIGVNPSGILALTALYAVTILVLSLIYVYLLTPNYFGEPHGVEDPGFFAKLPQMVLLGQAVGVLGYALLRNHYQFSGVSVAHMVFLAFAFAVAEEYYLRGLLQQQAMQIFHPIAAAVLSATFGVLLYFNQHVLIALLVIIPLEIACATSYYKKQNLLLTIALNASAKLTYVGLVTAFVLH